MTHNQWFSIRLFLGLLLIGSFIWLGLGRQETDRILSVKQSSSTAKTPPQQTADSPLSTSNSNLPPDSLKSEPPSQKLSAELLEEPLEENLEEKKDSTSDQKSSNNQENGLFQVQRAIDGDTIELQNGQKVRYIGVDTPETNDPRKGVEYFGREAKEKNQQLVEGQLIRLEKDISETDKYGRLLRYVFLPSGIMVNLLLIQEGYGKILTIPPDVKHAAQFLKAQTEAMAGARGLWSPEKSPLSSCLIKGNISTSDEKIYHLPGGRFYNQTSIDENKGERWFCNEPEAQEAGWRKSKQ